MTANEFDRACTTRLIDPTIAIENDEINVALCDRDDDKVLTLLDTQF